MLHGKECPRWNEGKEIWEYKIQVKGDVLNDPQLTDINEVRGVNHELCYDIFMNASMYALEFLPIGFQIYTGKIIIKYCFFL